MSRRRARRRLTVLLAASILNAAVWAWTGAAQEAAPAGEATVLAWRPLAGTRADVAALLLGGGDSGALWAAALAIVDGPRVDFWIELDGSRLLEDDGSSERAQTLRLELHAYAMTAAGELAGSVSRWVRLDLAEHGETLAAGGVKLAGALELEGGEYRLRVLVREPRSQRFALRVLTVTVPETGAPFQPPLAFPDVAGAWIVVRDAASDAPLPAALPVLPSDREATAKLRGRVTGPALAARLLDAERQAVADLELRTSPAAGDPEALEARFTLPDGIGPGAYLLELSGGGGAAVTQPVFVLGPLGEESVAWTAVRRLAADPEGRRQALELAEARRSAQRVAAIAEAYRGVLARLASGATDAAVAVLRELEIEVLSSNEDHPSHAARWLRKAEERVIGEIAGHDPEGLVPLLMLHLKVHARYLDEGVTDPFLVNGTRTRVLDLARGYARQSKSDLAPSLAAAALAEMGVALEQARLPMTAGKMLEEALALDESNAAGLLDLAYLYERHARHGEAAAALRRHLAVAPGSVEGRARLALVLLRLSEQSEAERLLRQVIAGRAPDWLLTVAYQELGRLLLAQGRGEEAASLLEAGVSRLPAEQRLYVVLAYALDRGGRRRRGSEVIARLPAAAGAVSPRRLYSRRPRDADPRSHASLVRQATARLPLLSRALAEGGE